MVVPNPVLPGHIVLCLRQPHVKYSEINVQQLFDLTLAIKELTEVIHERHTTQRVSTSTVMLDSTQQISTSQDASSEDTQLISQLHVHLIPRQINHNMSNEELNACIGTFGTK